ncbi:IS1096 element passenger TnpR family protein [Porphyromonas levii]|uniref:IS1096 element passenger TnpR family protein n=1 Tax=Porphyromonas levii TaxID=28114 RepID=UPI001BAAF15A|nr:hypothetical protein [Porphyromonas levii]MBR8703449.1 hypothetical protein [Porphyromonas levii]
MIYRFVMVSDEAPNFLREVRIDGTATFRELQDAILDAVGFSNDQITSFFISDKSWKPKQEILLIDMGLHGTDEEYYLMDDTYLDDFLEDAGDRLLFQFDQLGDRYFYIELKEVILGEQLSKPQCTRKKGDAPKQLSDVMEILEAPAKPKKPAKAPAPTKDDDDINEFGSDDFDINELDIEGFDISEDSLD